MFRDTALVHRGLLVPDLAHDWEAVQGAHAGFQGLTSDIEHCQWSCSMPTGTSTLSSPCPTSDVSNIEVEEQLLPFSLTTDPTAGGFIIPAKPVLRVSSLKDNVIQVPGGTFTDKFLPPSANKLVPREVFTGDYFVSLHNIVSAPGVRLDGSTYPASTPNYLGARIKLAHTGLKPDRWRFHLIGYEHADIVQLIEHGFPLGLPRLLA